MDEPSFSPQSDASHVADATASPCPSCAEYLAGWKRAQADYANLKKDIERERSEFSKYANERLIGDLLPAVDQFETALSFTPDLATLPDEARLPFTAWVTGLKAVQSLWESVFRSIGVDKVKIDGTFDPQLHEAVGHEERQDMPADAIVRVVQAGWMLHGKLLRPARVIITSHVIPTNAEGSLN